MVEEMLAARGIMVSHETVRQSGLTHEVRLDQPGHIVSSHALACACVGDLRSWYGRLVRG
jgi:hypothetical protein